MKTLSVDDVVSQLKWRYATKVFDSTKKIPDEIWSKIEEVLILSPSSYGLQPYKFIVAKNPEVRAKLRAAAWKQAQVEGASHFVVFAHRETMEEKDIQALIDRVAEVRRVPVNSLDGYKNIMIGDLVKGPRHVIAGMWASRQVYIALGQLLTAAAMAGLDACPMEGFDPAAFDKILGLEGSGYKSVVACAVGYRSADDKYAENAKVRFEKKKLIG